MTERCTGTDCPGCEAARRHYLATGCLVPDCVRDHAAPTPPETDESNTEGAMST